MRQIGPRVNSCCFCLPAKIGVYIIVSLATVGALSNMFRMLALTDADLQAWMRYTAIATSGIVVLVNALLLVGVLKDMPFLLIPWLVVQGLGMFIYVLALAVFTAMASDEFENNYHFSLFIAGAVVFLILWMYSWCVVQTVYWDIKMSNEGPEAAAGFDPAVGRGPLDGPVQQVPPGGVPVIIEAGRSQPMNPFSGEPVKHPAMSYQNGFA